MNMPPAPLPSYSDHEPIELFRYLRTLVDAAEQASSPFPKFALVEAYWHIGRIIVEIEQAGQARADYGIHLIESLSEQLTQAFGKGYSLPNMWRFKQFFLAFPILSTNGRELMDLRQHLRTELTWSHYRILMQLENLQERAFYLNQAADERWTVRFMQRLIRTRYYYQVALGDTRLLPGSPAGNMIGKTNTPTLSAVGGTTRTRLASIKKIMLDRYVGFAFVGQRQFVSVNGQDQWAELVFFNYLLNRFVLVQLGEFGPVSQAAFVQLIDAYCSKQPPGFTNLPIGLLVNQHGQIKLLTSSQEQGLSQDDSSRLPVSFA